MSVRGLDRYILSTRLSSGAIGEVFLARTRGEQGPLVWLKRLHPEVAKTPHFLRLLQTESAAGLSFRHANVVPLAQVERSPEGGFITAPLVRGQPLSDVLRRARVEGAPLAQTMLAWIGAELADALTAAHRVPWFDGAPSPLVHGSLSPRGVVIGYDGRILLTGLGYGRARARVQPSIGRMPYVAPEVLSGREMGPRTDIYSLAVSLHDAFSGRAVYRRPTADASRQAVLAGNAPPLAPRTLRINPEIGELLQQMMAPRVEARPELMAEVATRLRAAAGPTASFEEQLGERVRRLFAEDKEAEDRRLQVALGQHSRSGRARTAPQVMQVPDDTPVTSPPAGAIPTTLELPEPVMDEPSPSAAAPDVQASSAPSGEIRPEAPSRAEAPSEPPQLRLVPEEPAPAEAEAEAEVALTPEPPVEVVLTPEPPVEATPVTEAATAGEVAHHAEDLLPAEARPVGDVAPPPEPVVEPLAAPADVEPEPVSVPKAVAEPEPAPAPAQASAVESSPTVPQAQPQAAAPAAPASSGFVQGILGRVRARPASRKPSPPQARLIPAKPKQAPDIVPPPNPQRPFAGLLDQAASEGLTDHLPEFEVSPTEEDDIDVDIIIDEPDVAEPEVATTTPMLQPEVAAQAPESPSEPLSVPLVQPAPASEPAVSAPPPQPLEGNAQDPSRLGRYEVLRRVEGPQPGLRLLAHDSLLTRDVWIDVLQDEGAQAQARWLAKVSHPRLPQVLDAGEHDGRVYCARAAVQGSALAEAVQQPWPEEAVRHIVGDLADALEVLHQARLCAGGIQVDDIWRDAEGRGVIVDLPRLFPASGPEHPQLRHSLHVLPPEYMEGAGFTRSGDLFSLGLLAHRLLTGQDALPPEPEARAKVLRGGQIPVPTLADSVLQDVLRQLLAPAPRARFARASEVVAQLSRSAVSEPARGAAVGPESQAHVILVDPDVTPAQARRILQERGVRAAVFASVEPALVELHRLQARSLIVARASKIDEEDVRRRAWAVNPKVDLRFVPPAASRMVGPPLSLEGLADAWMNLAPRVLVLGATEAGFVPTLASRSMAQSLELGLRTELLAGLTAGARLLARRLGESTQQIASMMPEEVPPILEAVARLDAGTMTLEQARPAARVVAVADAFYRATRLDAVAPSRALADIKAQHTGPVGSRLVEALIAHLRELYATGDLAPPAADAPQVLVARRERSPALVKMLEFDGLRVEEASDGDEAWDLVRTIKPAVVILDDHLQGRDGAAVIELSRVHPALSDIRFLLLASPDDADLRQRLATLEHVHIIDRGASVEALRARVSAVIEAG